MTKIKNNPADYQRSTAYSQAVAAWASNTVTIKKKAIEPDDPTGRKNYVYHPDPEINECAKEFTEANYGRPSWQVNGELYADFLSRFRKLEEATGILSRQPTDEMLENSAMLREAYKKYKFVEKLALKKNL